MKLLTFVALIGLSACWANAKPTFLEGETVDSLQFYTSDCSQCGMTLFGSIMTKVCGDISCCLTPWDQGSFNEGGIDIFSGVDIGECDKFTFKSGPTGADQIGVTVFHQGSDALKLDTVRIVTTNSTTYSCRMPNAFVDNSQFIDSEACLKL